MTRVEAIAAAYARRLITKPAPHVPPCRVCGQPGDGHQDARGALCAECSTIAIVRGDIRLPRTGDNDDTAMDNSI